MAKESMKARESKAGWNQAELSKVEESATVQVVTSMEGSSNGSVR